MSRHAIELGLGETGEPESFHLRSSTLSNPSGPLLGAVPEGREGPGRAAVWALIDVFSGRLSLVGWRHGPGPPLQGR